MTSLTDRTERALLGALLTSPGGAALSYLQRTDFTCRQRGDILAGIRTAYKADRWPGQRWLDSVAAACGSVVTTRELNDLQADCPVPRHANGYASLVIEARVRRIIAEVADRITLDTGGFEFDALRLAGLRAPSAIMTAALTRHLNDLAGAFKIHTEFDPGTWQPLQVPEPPPLPQAIPASLPSLAWQPSQLGEKPGPRARTEEHVLAGLMQRHTGTPLVVAVVTPDMFTSPLRRCIYSTIQAMEARGHPIDDITVEWGLARRLSSAGAAESVPFASTETGPGYLTQLTRTPIGPAGMITAARTLAQAPAATGPHQHAASERPAPRLIQPVPKPRQDPAGPTPAL
jgi:hypothetical protein